MRGYWDCNKRYTMSIIILSLLQLCNCGGISNTYFKLRLTFNDKCLQGGAVKLQDPCRSLCAAHCFNRGCVAFVYVHRTRRCRHMMTFPRIKQLDQPVDGARFYRRGSSFLHIHRTLIQFTNLHGA